jgi:dihydrofolate reductase
VTADKIGAHGRQTQKRPTQFVHVAAVAENGVIGRAGTLPWRLKSDMQHFRRLTMGKPVVMGRRTYLSLSRKPLPGRTNIVVSRDRTFAAPGVVVAATLDAGLAVARADALRRGGDEIIVIGGSDVFRQTMAMADRLEITLVHMRPEGDSAFPPIDPRVWQEMSRREQAAGPNDEASFTLLVYRRRLV